VEGNRGTREGGREEAKGGRSVANGSRKESSRKERAAKGFPNKQGIG
jgi:hypothetical protein